jgi:small-conductance mechanosensitive channel
MFSQATKAAVVTGLAVGFALFLTTLVRYSIIPQLEPPVLYSIFAVLAGIVAYYILSALASRIEEPKLRFTFTKITLVVAAAVIVGWLVLAFERPFSVGDRIEINNVAGDVIDYGFFFVKVMEIREWTDADLYTGRILLVPTNWILTNTVYNYTKDFSYIWDKLWIGLLYGADYTKVANEIKEMAAQITQPTTEMAKQDYFKVEKKYFLKDTTFEPQVFVSFNSNWVQLDLRYITEIKVRSKTRSDLSTMILKYLNENGITVASSSMNVNVAEQK